MTTLTNNFQDERKLEIQDGWRQTGSTCIAACIDMIESKIKTQIPCFLGRATQ